ncbi:MAG: winged helix-turn-helix transcriptional regulator [Alphaproteobacteria bacterium GM202ARS2]|nr:winged helix-turn-helix transcriptional regulator [Alphaproteobacteria bacterium GM202ARS2]
MAPAFLLRSDNPLCVEVIRYHSESVLSVPLHHLAWGESFAHVAKDSVSCVIHDSPPDVLDSTARFTDTTTLTDWQHVTTTHIALLPDSATALQWPRADKVFFKPVSLNDLFTTLDRITHNQSIKAIWTLQTPGQAQDHTTYLFDENTRQLFHQDGIEVDISEQEKAFLALLVAERGNVVSKASLHRRLMGLGTDAQTHSIETLVYRLRRKIEQDASQPMLLQTAPNGYYIDTPDFHSDSG